MSEHKPKSLILILAREFASNLATPIYIADAEGTLVYYNEPAEAIAGRPFSETGEIPMREWSELLAPEALDGRPLEREEMPGGIAHYERHPAHGTLRVTGLDGKKRVIESTVFPLFGAEDEFHGTMAVFWEQK